MTDTNSSATQAASYREIANSIRALIPTMRFSEAREHLSVLALGYERLAACLEAVSESLQTASEIGRSDPTVS
jgi:hypothetical protein